MNGKKFQLDGRIVKSCLALRGETMTVLSQKTGIAPASLCRMLKGAQLANMQHVAAITKYLGISLRRLTVKKSSEIDNSQKEE